MLCEEAIEQPLKDLADAAVEVGLSLEEFVTLAVGDDLHCAAWRVADSGAR